MALRRLTGRVAIRAPSAGVCRPVPALVIGSDPGIMSFCGPSPTHHQAVRTGRSTRATSSASGTASSLNRGAASGVPTPGQQLLGPGQHHRHFDAQLGRLLGLIGPATKRTACQQPQTLVTREDDCRLRGCPDHT